MQEGWAFQQYSPSYPSPFLLLSLIDYIPGKGIITSHLNFGVGYTSIDGINWTYYGLSAVGGPRGSDTLINDGKTFFYFPEVGTTVKKTTLSETGVPTVVSQVIPYSIRPAYGLNVISGVNITNNAIVYSTNGGDTWASVTGLGAGTGTRVTLFLNGKFYVIPGSDAGGVGQQ